MRWVARSGRGTDDGVARRRYEKKRRPWRVSSRNSIRNNNSWASVNYLSNYGTARPAGYTTIYIRNIIETKPWPIWLLMTIRATRLIDNPNSESRNKPTSGFDYKSGDVVFSLAAQPPMIGQSVCLLSTLLYPRVSAQLLTMIILISIL